MADEKNDPNTPAERTKRPNTIDLKATEITPEPVERAEQPAATGAPASRSEAETATKDESSDEAGAGSTDAGPEAGSPPPRDPPSSASTPSPGNRLWPLIAIAAAAIVFFAAGLVAGPWLATRQQPASATASSSPELVARIDKLEKQLGEPRKDDSQLQARLAKLEAQLGAPRAADQQLLARIVAAEAAVKTLADMTAAREKRSDEIAALAHEARNHASNAVSAAETAQKSQTASPEARADLDALTTRIATLEQSARTSQAELAKRLSADDSKGRFAISAIALRDAVNSGMPFAAELAAVKSLSGDAAAVAALEPFASSGVPSAASLGRELAGLMPAIWKIARKDEVQQGTFLERLQSNASKIVRIRPAGEVAGDDPTSVSARIESRADRADIRGALAELSKLPADARAPAESWVKKAEARNAAIAAARNISQTALGALAKPGS